MDSSLSAEALGLAHLLAGEVVGVAAAAAPEELFAVARLLVEVPSLDVSPAGEGGQLEQAVGAAALSVVQVHLAGGALSTKVLVNKEVFMLHFEATLL